MPPHPTRPKASTAPHAARVRDAVALIIVLVEVRVAEGAASWGRCRGGMITGTRAGDGGIGAGETAGVARLLGRNRPAAVTTRVDDPRDRRPTRASGTPFANPRRGCSAASGACSFRHFRAPSSPALPRVLHTAGSAGFPHVATRWHDRCDPYRAGAVRSTRTSDSATWGRAYLEEVTHEDAKRDVQASGGCGLDGSCVGGIRAGFSGRRGTGVVRAAALRLAAAGM